MSDKKVWLLISNDWASLQEVRPVEGYRWFRGGGSVEGNRDEWREMADHLADEHPTGPPPRFERLAATWRHDRGSWVQLWSPKNTNSDDGGFWVPRDEAVAVGRQLLVELDAADRDDPVAEVEPTAEIPLLDGRPDPDTGPTLDTDEPEDAVEVFDNPPSRPDVDPGLPGEHEDAAEVPPPDWLEQLRRVLEMPNGIAHGVLFTGCRVDEVARDFPAGLAALGAKLREEFADRLAAVRRDLLSAMEETTARHIHGRPPADVARALDEVRREAQQNLVRTAAELRTEFHAHVVEAWKAGQADSWGAPVSRFTDPGVTGPGKPTRGERIAQAATEVERTRVIALIRRLASGPDVSDNARQLLELVCTGIVDTAPEPHEPIPAMPPRPNTANRAAFEDAIRAERMSFLRDLVKRLRTAAEGMSALPGNPEVIGAFTFATSFAAGLEQELDKGIPMPPPETAPHGQSFRAVIERAVADERTKIVGNLMAYAATAPESAGQKLVDDHKERKAARHFAAMIASREL
jgi:hypothetical protein